MSEAKLSFESSIKDAENLLAHFDAMPKPPPPHAEVLKRAGLVMALTAWETYVEDRVLEEVKLRLRMAEGSYVGKFVLTRLEQEEPSCVSKNTFLATEPFRPYNPG